MVSRVLRGLITGTPFVFFYLGGFLCSWLVLPILALPIGTRAERVDRSRRLVSRTFQLFHWYMRVTRLFHFDPRDNDLRLPDGPCVIVANHPTLIDITAMVSMYPQLSTIVKRALFRSPLIGMLLRFCDYVPGGDGTREGAAGVVDSAVAQVQSGSPLLLFPEGTRSPPGSLHPMKRGAFEIASRAGVAVVPVVIRCEPPVLSKAHPWYRVPPTTPVHSMQRLPDLDPARWGGDSRAMARDVERTFRQHLFGEPTEAAAEPSPAAAPA